MTLPPPLARLWHRVGQRGRNLGWSFAGQLLPALAGVVFVPLLIKALGTARFGFLSLVWVLIGYFSLFDLGLARALTHRVANLLAIGDRSQLRAAVRTGMALILALAAVSAPIVWLAHDLLLGDLIHGGRALAAEVEDAFPWLVLGVPVVIVSAGLRGILEGQHRFAAVNLIRTPAGMLMIAAPWLATQLIAPTLAVVTAAVVIVRLGQAIGFAALCRDVLIGRDGSPFDRGEIRLLFGFGLWITVSNIISPLLVYMDRFAISHFGNLSDVAYYTTPFDLVARLLFVNNSVSAVVFPALAAAYATDPRAMQPIARQNFLVVFVLVAPVALIMLLFAHPGMRLWVGPAFAAKSSGVLQILCVGILVNSLASVAATTLQAMRRADLTARFHIVELPCYVVLLVVLVRNFGITGAALAWLVRVSADAALLYYAAWRLRWSHDASAQPAAA